MTPILKALGTRTQNCTAAWHAEGLIIRVDGGPLAAAAPHVIELATAHRLPAVYVADYLVQQGGLASMGPARAPIGQLPPRMSTRF